MRKAIAAVLVLIASPALAENAPCFDVVPLSAPTMQWPPAILVNKCTGDTWALDVTGHWSQIPHEKQPTKIMRYDSNGNLIK